MSATGLLAGGTIALVAGSRVIQTTRATLDTSSREDLGGTILVQAISAGNATLAEAQRSRVFSSAKYNTTGQVGGRIDVLAGDVVLAAARLDAYGARHGGTVLVGGDLHGANSTIANAITVSVNGSATIDVSATENGNAGKVVVWSDSLTRYSGSVFAKGGAQGGNGGIVEISGKDTLQFAGLVDAGAPRGIAGTLLLDPKNIVIDAAGSLPSFQLLDPSPASGKSFGQANYGDTQGITTLPNNNVVVLDRRANQNSGAVYMFDGRTGGLISALLSDQVVTSSGPSRGIGDDITQLVNGNFVVTSGGWGGVGAATWGSAVTGVNGFVSQRNSLVGSNQSDYAGGYVTPLTNGNYAVLSANWANGGVVQAGAVTWGNGTTGPAGVISAANSLVGTSTSDQIGGTNPGVGLLALSNGNYLVASSGWSSNTGAVTWGNGLGGTVGEVSAANSLVGRQPGDKVGSGTVVALANGNYVVSSPNWSSDTASSVGAVTWGDGRAGSTGMVSPLNSLVGTHGGDRVGEGDLNYGTKNSSVIALANGNYVVSSASWSNGNIARVGAVTWGNGMTGSIGTVSVSNSLIGIQAGDAVGSAGAVALTNGNYVIGSPNWANVNITAAGAATWADGSAATVGMVSAVNSLIGTNTNDRVGTSTYSFQNQYVPATPLTNGNYVVNSPQWGNGRGAATWGNGTSGTVGEVSAANSLVGSFSKAPAYYGDQVSNGGIIALANGNYVVNSFNWSNGGAQNSGAATWGSGVGGTAGVVSAANSLVGSQQGDFVAAFVNNLDGVAALRNGNYVVISGSWANGTAQNSGAVTWGNGNSGTTGVVSINNSLVGTQNRDYVGAGGNYIELSDGSFAFNSAHWANGSNANAGAVTRISGTASTSGVLSAANSLVGTHAGDYIGYDGIAPLANGNFVVASSYVNNNAGRVDVVATSTPTFASDPAVDITVSPQWITAITNTGTAVKLQANNDIVVNSPVVTTASGSGGSLTLQAGRGISINANITTDNGALSLSANDPGANPAFREGGVGTITMAAGTAIDTGTGAFNANLNGAAGTITLRDVRSGFVNANGAVVSLGATTLQAFNLSGGNLDVATGAVINVAGQASVGSGGTLSISGGTLNAGSLSVGGTPGGSLLLNGGSLNAGATTVNSGGVLSLASGAANFSSTIDVQSGGTLNYQLASGATVPGVFSNAGTINIDADGLALRGGYLQTGGFTKLGTSITAPANITAGGSGMQINGGTLGGSGTITGNLGIGAGILSPGFSPGSITVTGNLTLAPTSTTTIELGGLTPGSGYDVINVNGAANLAGTLNVASYAGYVAGAGTTYNFLNYGSTSGSFSSVNVPTGSGITLTTLAAFSQLAVSAPGIAPPASTTLPTNTALIPLPVLVTPQQTLLADPATTSTSSSAAGATAGNAGGVGSAAANAASALPIMVAGPTSTAANAGSVPANGSRSDASSRIASAVGVGQSAEPSWYVLADGVVPYFRNLSLSEIDRPDLASMLDERRAYKFELLAVARALLETDPDMADVLPCTQDQAGDVDSGKCALSEAMQKELLRKKVTDERKFAKLNAHVPQIAHKRALVIGLNKYADKRIPQLVSAIPDARSMRDALSDKLGYDVTLLENPGKAQILQAFNRLALEMGASDSVVVYFAGHGDLIEKTQLGYWIPADAKADDPRGWISNKDVSKLLSLVKSQQVAMISDSCYSGTFAREQTVNATQGKTARNAADYLTQRTVTVMTSGSDEPVADTGKSGHSVFAWNLLEQINQLDDWRSGATVFSTVRTSVERELPQSPQYGASLSAGHQQGGDFLFERRERALA